MPTTTPIPDHRSPEQADLPAGPEAVAAFWRTGRLHLRGVLADCLTAQQLIWDGLRQAAGCERDRPETWSGMNASHLKPLARLPAFDIAAVPRVRAVVDRLLGPGWSGPGSGGGFFLNAPTPPGSRPQLPRGTWHWDGRMDLTPAPSLALFTLVERLGPGEGGTYHVAGSHHLVRDLFAGLAPGQRSAPSKTQRRRFQERHPWFHQLQQPASDHQPLVDRLLGEGLEVDGQLLRIHDVAGEAGDVVIVPGFTIHSAPAFIGPRPRVVHVVGTGAGSGGPEPMAG